MTRDEIAVEMAKAILGNQTILTTLALRQIPVSTYAVVLADDLLNALRTTAGGFGGDPLKMPTAGGVS